MADAGRRKPAAVEGLDLARHAHRLRQPRRRSGARAVGRPRRPGCEKHAREPRHLHGGDCGGAALRQASAQTQLGATLFFWARLAYWPCYLAGIIYLRTAIWLVSIVGLAMVALAVLP
jgi:hypothetical protein